MALNFGVIEPTVYSKAYELVKTNRIYGENVNNFNAIIKETSKKFKKELKEQTVDFNQMNKIFTI